MATTPHDHTQPVTLARPRRAARSVRASLIWAAVPLRLSLALLASGLLWVLILAWALP